MRIPGSRRLKRRCRWIRKRWLRRFGLNFCLLRIGKTRLMRRGLLLISPNWGTGIWRKSRCIRWWERLRQTHRKRWKKYLQRSYLRACMSIRLRLIPILSKSVWIVWRVLGTLLLGSLSFVMGVEVSSTFIAHFGRILGFANSASPSKKSTSQRTNSKKQMKSHISLTMLKKSEKNLSQKSLLRRRSPVKLTFTRCVSLGKKLRKHLHMTCRSWYWSLEMWGMKMN